MNRRDTVLALLALGATPASAFAQQQNRAWRIGFLGTAFASGYVRELDSVRAGLRKLGYVEGNNIAIEYRWAESDPGRLKEMAAELVALKVDVIVTHSIPGASAAMQATSTIPIVMADGADPVAAGLTTSLARPSCEGPIGCLCPFGLDLRNWESPNPRLSQGAQPNEHP